MRRIAQLTESQRSLILWSGLTIAFSPVLQNLVASLVDEAEQRYILIAPVLITLLLLERSELPEVAPARVGRLGRRTGLVLLVTGLGAQVLGIAGETWLIARLGLPLGAIGLALILGRPDPRVLLLVFAMVPIPDFVKHATSPAAESWLASGAAWLFERIGVELEVGGPLVRYNGGRFELKPGDNGLVTALLLAEYGWYAALRMSRDTARALENAIRWALLGVVVQPVATILCIAALPAGVPSAGRFVLTYGVALAVGLVALGGYGLRIASPPAPRPDSRESR